MTKPIMIHSRLKVNMNKTVGLLFFCVLLLTTLTAQDSLLISVDSNLVQIDSSLTSLKKDSLITENKYTLNKVNHSEAHNGKGLTRIIQDERINTLDKIIKENPYEHEGFRIQIIFGSLGVVNGKEASFKNKYSYRTYKDFLPPNFRLRVGDFPTKQLAEKHLYRIRQSFPDAYIVKDSINTPSKYR